MNKIEDIIAEQRNSLKTDRLDMSFGELMNMFEDGDLFIDPEYQRAFRWSLYQQTRFIESVLLGIPIPPIFVAEDNEGTWEVVDGLQRMSTIFAFFGLLNSQDMKEKNHSILTKGAIVEELEGLTIDDLPLRLRTTIKRAVCRVEIVRWDSNEDVRYELFNRLNTGASPLSAQEIRNCIFRSSQVNLNQVLRDIASNQTYVNLISTTKSKQEKMYLEELVLRYFLFKRWTPDMRFDTTVAQALTNFMRAVSKGEIKFDLVEEKKQFLDLVYCLNNKCDGKKVFRPRGQFSLHLFDSISHAVPNTFDSIDGNEERIARAISKLHNDEKYNAIGTSTFSYTRITERMKRAREIFSNA